MGPIEGDGSQSEVRERIHAAAVDELARWGIDRFSIEALADRHGLDPNEIRRYWPDREALIVDVLVSGPRGKIVVPDTGSLRDDLFALALGMAHYVTTGDGHQMQGTHLIADPQLGKVDIRRKVWQMRASWLAVVFDRARERGELRAGVQATTALELLFAPINMRALFTGEPIDDQYCRTLGDLVWRAISVTG